MVRDRHGNPTGLLLANPNATILYAKQNYAEYGGAPLLGLQGLPIVCHGRSSALAMTNAIKMSGTFVRKGTNSRLAETILANEELTRFSRAI